jgi:hypothetical protein
MAIFVFSVSLSYAGLKLHPVAQIGNPPSVSEALSYEDFTAATEVDTQNKITVAANSITFDYVENVEAYVYWDAGENYFAEDYEIQFTINVTSGDNSIMMVSFLSNTLDDSRAAHQASDGQGVRVTPDATDFTMNISDYSNGLMSLGVTGLSLSTNYYCTLIRSDAEETYGKVYLNVYSDSDRTNVVGAVSITLNHGRHDYRYLYPASGYNIGDADTVAGVVSNMTVVSPGLP